MQDGMPGTSLNMVFVQRIRIFGSLVLGNPTQTPDSKGKSACCNLLFAEIHLTNEIMGTLKEGELCCMNSTMLQP